MEENRKPPLNMEEKGIEDGLRGDARRNRGIPQQAQEEEEEEEAVEKKTSMKKILNKDKRKE